MKKKLLVGALVILVVIAAMIARELNEASKEVDEVRSFYDHALAEYYPILVEIDDYYVKQINEFNGLEENIEDMEKKLELEAAIKEGTSEVINTDLNYEDSLAAKKNLLNLMEQYEALISHSYATGTDAKLIYDQYVGEIERLLEERGEILRNYYDFSYTTESASE